MNGIEFLMDHWMEAREAAYRSPDFQHRVALASRLRDVLAERFSRG